MRTLQRLRDSVGAFFVLVISKGSSGSATKSSSSSLLTATATVTAWWPLEEEVEPREVELIVLLLLLVSLYLTFAFTITVQLNPIPSGTTNAGLLCVVPSFLPLLWFQPIPMILSLPLFPNSYCWPILLLALHHLHDHSHPYITSPISSKYRIINTI